jgi:hypothetical protein
MGVGGIVGEAVTVGGAVGDEVIAGAARCVAATIVAMSAAAVLGGSTLLQAGITVRRPSATRPR